MEILIFGIDGLGEKSLQALGLKRLAARLKQGQTNIPKVDNVISRGWCEIYTGMDAYKTGGFYQVPQMVNGQIKPSQNTGLSTIKKIIGDEPLLWNVLQNSGYKVGVFAVPSTSKIEQVNGFFVSATGAGKFGNTMGCDDVFPRQLLDGLWVKQLDLGLRMGYGAYIPKNLQDLEETGNKHLADFFYILERVLSKNPVDICFAASRFVTEIAYKFLGLCAGEPKSEYEKQFKETVLNLTDNFDAKLDQLINNLNPKHLFIVSDHGIGTYEYDVNLNGLLKEAGLIDGKWTAKNLLKPYFNPIRSHFNGKTYPPIVPTYDMDHSEFFSIGYMNAIYLRDERFGGEVHANEAAYEKSQILAEKLNTMMPSKGLADKLSFIAKNTDKYVGNDDTKIPLPNIVCNMAEGLFNSERVSEIIAKRVFDFSENLFKNGFFGEYSGCKANDTIAYYNGSMGAVDLSDLKNIYHSILSVSKYKGNAG